MSQYFVAFRGTQTSGAFEGIITWTGWPTKMAFDEWRESSKGKESLKQAAVLEEGITEERAIQLVKSTPIESRILHAMHEATDPETGVLNKERAKFIAKKTAWVIGHSLDLV